MLDMSVILQHWELFATGTRNTAIVCIVTFFAGWAMAIPLGLARAYKIPILDQLTQIWIYVFRGTPLLILVYLFYYGLAQFDFIRDSFLWPILREAWWCVMITLSINTSAFMAEIVRVAVLSVPKGEVEAATATGLTGWQSFRRIIAPRAFGLALPMIGNEAILKIHSSAIISAVTVNDVLSAGRYINARYYMPYEGFLASAVIYFILVSITIWCLGQVERRMLEYLRERQS